MHVLKNNRVLLYAERIIMQKCHMHNANNHFFKELAYVKPFKYPNKNLSL